MRRPLLLLSFCVVALSARAAAQDLRGRYEVAGVAAVGSYSGRARIGRTLEGWRLEVVRDDGVRALGRLARQPAPAGATAAVASASVWTFEAPLRSATGLAGALGGEAAPARRLRARYLELPGRLIGRWQVLEAGATGETVVASGHETLRRPLPAGSRGRVRIAVSVDWEGRDLQRTNLGAMVTMRQALPGVPITHFLNAAYLTKPNADAAAVASALRETVLPGDESGLHVHGWRSLFTAAGATFRDRPSFWGEGIPLQPSADDLGHEVEIGAYPVADLRRVVRRSRELLASIGFPLGASFRAGGWMATPNVLEAVRAEGFLVDSSATDGRWHDELGTYRLRSRIPEVWPQVTSTSAPYLIETPAGAILEMPDTCALADYVTPDEMVRHVREAAGRLAAAPDQDVFVHVGFHQETAARYGRRLTDALLTLAGDRSLPIVLETLEDSARAARAALR